MNAAFPIPMAFLGGSMSGGEIMLILLAMLLLFGSKKLPEMARNLGKAMESFRRASREVTDEIMRADLAETVSKKPVDDAYEETAPEVKSTPQAVNRDESSGV